MPTVQLDGGCCPSRRQRGCLHVMQEAKRLDERKDSAICASARLKRITTITAVGLRSNLTTFASAFTLVLTRNRQSKQARSFLLILHSDRMPLAIRSLSPSSCDTSLEALTESGADSFHGHTHSTLASVLPESEGEARERDSRKVDQQVSNASDKSKCATVCLCL